MGEALADRDCSGGLLDVSDAPLSRRGRLADAEACLTDACASARRQAVGDFAAGVELNEPFERAVDERMIGIAAGEEEVGVGGQVERPALR